MRNSVLLACVLACVAVLAGAAGAAEPSAGVLSVERARGTVILDLRGSVLGRLGAGTLRVTDLTPRDRFAALVAGRKLQEEPVGPRTVVYRGQGLRFRMLGGGYRVVIRGSGISLSAVGRGVVVLQAERRLPGEDAGVYSLAGVDCGLEPELCTALPEEATRLVLGPEDGTARTRP